LENVSYLETVYQAWRKDPSSVDPSWAHYFLKQESDSAHTPGSSAPRPSQAQDTAYKQSRVDSLLWAYRDIGYLYAQLNPLGGDYGPDHTYIHSEEHARYEQLTLKHFGLEPHDLDTVFSAGRGLQPDRAPLRDIIKGFRQTYCESIGVEFLHIQNKDMRRWLIERMESCRNQPSLDDRHKRIILRDLLRTESLEQGLHTFFVGQKRFSLEGSEAIIPGLHFLANNGLQYGIEDIVIGTTHRGRLSILNTIMHMKPEEIFSTFDENIRPRTVGGTGDVKYHIGYETDHVHKNSSVVHVSLVANSSHLESVDAVVQGKARAIQDLNYGRDRKRVLPVILHGDAAFSGQGIVAETLNLSRLKGYTTGGTIHIIINNQIGFTTASHQARSTFFPTDMAKALPVPIFHVNGDDPEALIHAADMALQFRQTFGADCVLDVFCFRRYGHNESDEPSFTHPYMYRLIKNHPGVATLYGRLCAATGVVSDTEQNNLRQKYAATLKEALQRTRDEHMTQVNTSQGEAWDELDSDYSFEPVPTGVPQKTLTRIARHITTVPDRFHAHRTLERILARNWKAFAKSKRVDWAFAESLALGSLLIEGLQVRLSGEDCARGTFSQRHMTWWDTHSEKPASYTPLRTLQESQARMDVYDSPLSEYSVLGFEYGYALVDPHALTIWEAQFGDFVNGAQVVIDNYIASALHKWDRNNGLVLLLPHGNEGQGPDHSSGHLARFMQLGACHNMQILNLTTPAQYFHALRHQMKAGYRRPMVIMSPKSLLRHPRALSPVVDLTRERFHQVLDDTCSPEQVTNILICSGKVYYDLKARQDYMETKTTAVLRLEQLYPFPEQSLKTCFARYPQVRQVTWVQEEPKNYGAWASLRERFITHFPAIDLQYVGREESASSATGSSRLHKEQQEQLVEQAFAGPTAPTTTPASTKQGDIA